MSNGMKREVPAKIGKYDVLDVLGRGGMGVVYRARDSRIGREVAIKTLTEGFAGSPEMLRRFYQEAGHTGTLRHPNIVTVYDFGDEDGQPYIVMEYLDGQPLDRIIRDKHLIDLATRVSIIDQVCCALGYAHERGVIHRDVKPANIVVQRDGLVKLLDFGIARTEIQPADSMVTQTGTLVGTPAYMAPERLRGESFDGRSDIFSTGVVLYQLLTGVLPFAADYPENIQQILHQDPSPLSKHLASCPAQLDVVVARALAKNPQQRYARADDMAADLKPVGRQLRSERASELMGEARAAVTAQQYDRAREILNQLLRSDSQHTGARRLMTSVERQLSKQATKQRVQQMIRLVHESINARNWDQARSVCSEALGLEATNRELLALHAKIDAATQTREQIQLLLREAEAARHAGNYDEARRNAGKASHLDPSDSRVQAVCRLLEQEAEEATRKARLRELLRTASSCIASGLLAEAAKALDEAEQTSSADLELLHLRDELADAMRREERRTVIQTLQEHIDLAVTHEDLLAAMNDLATGLAKYPTEPVLLRMKLQLEPRLRDQNNRKMIADVTAACRQLSSAGALERIREALAALPGNPELMALEAAMLQRQTRTEREQRQTGYLRRARELLDRHLYLEAVTVLEECESQGFSSAELTDLLETARQAASQRTQEELAERIFPEVRRLSNLGDYAAVIRLLETVLQRVDDSALHRELAEAQEKQKSLDQQVDQVLALLKRYRELELFDAIPGLVDALPPTISKDERIRAERQIAHEGLRVERELCELYGSIYARLDRADPAAWTQAEQKSNHAGVHAKMASVQNRLRERLRAIADDNVRRSIAASQAAAPDDSNAARELLESVSLWKPVCSAEVQAAWTAAQAEAAAAQKILRFRKRMG